jgi:predicted phosphate transport protein (TIGR00153 family)
MVFPVESEDRTLRNMLMMCQDHARLVVEVYRKVLVMIDNLAKGNYDGMKQRLDEIEKLNHESNEIKRNLMKELHETGALLFNREDLYRLISKASEVVDYIEGIGVRLWAIGNMKWAIPPDVGKGIVEVSDAVFDVLTKVRESLISLGFNSERSLTLTKEVDEGERRVDRIYRELDLKIITSEAPLPLILTLRDIVQHLEDLVDKATEEADLIRILAL